MKSLSGLAMRFVRVGTDYVWEIVLTARPSLQISLKRRSLR